MKIIGTEEMVGRIASVARNLRSEVKRYSKYKVYLRLSELGLWNVVKSFMEENGLYDAWQACQELSSGNDQFDGCVAEFRKAYPGVDVDALLAECEIKDA